MKYRHTFHAGNFADVHKHVTLLALLTALQRKEKGFAYLETHAGRGRYELSTEASAGIGRLMGKRFESRELQNFTGLVADFRVQRSDPRAYPGSPLIAARTLRAHDRALLCELLPREARALERELATETNCRVEEGDGFQKLRGWLPPSERRGLVLIDPPYEQTGGDFQSVTAALADSMKRFRTGVYALWYPIKNERDTRAWHAQLSAAVSGESLISELWLYPRDSRVALNGSGLVIVNPPYGIADRAQIWLPELASHLDPAGRGGTSVTNLTRAT